MTNEEKAKEIAEYYTDTNDIGVALNSAKEMAEWKEDEIKAYLKYKREKYLEMRDNERRVHGSTAVFSYYDNRAELCRELLIELFGQDEIIQ